MAKLSRVFAAGLFTFTILMSLAGTTSAAVTGTFAWAAQGPDGQDPGLVLDSAGNAIESALYSQWLTKYNPAGQVVWAQTVEIMYMGLSAQLSGNMVVDAAGNIYVSGRNDFRSVDREAAVLGLAKISPSGTVLWTHSYEIGSGGEHMAAGPLALGTNGSLYVIGTSANFSQPTSPVAILKVDASTGAPQKALPVPTPPATPPATSDGSPNLSSTTLVLDSANNVFWGGPDGIRSYSADLQTLRWNDTQFAVRAAVLDAANNVYVAGYVANGSAYDYIVKRLNNTNGAQVWGLQNVGTPQSEPALRGFNGLVLDSRGQLYAVGSSNINALTTYKINAANGAIVWFKGDGSTDLSVTLDANDNVYVAGTSAFGQPSGDGIVTVYDPQGNVLWSQTYNGAGNDSDTFTRVAVDNKGGVYAASATYIPGGPGSSPTLTPVIVKYSESGLIFSGTYRVINRNSAKALDALSQGTANGTQIDQWTYNGGNNQRWIVTSLGYSQYKIVGVQSGRALDVFGNGTANGTKIDLWDYNGGINQKYTFTATSGGYFRITPANATGSCIDGVGFGTANGTLVDLWQYNGGNNQQWILQAP